MGSPRVAGLLSLALSDCVSVRISLPPSLIVFIRFIPSGFSCGKERVGIKRSMRNRKEGEGSGGRMKENERINRQC